MTETAERVTAAARRAELDKLVAKHGGTVTPQQIVRFAKNPRTALHTYFEWDDRVAGEQYRLAQAENYLRVVATVIEVPGSGEMVRVRALLSLPSDRGTGVYRPFEDVRDDPTRQAEYLMMLRREISSMQKRYRHVVMALPVLDAAAEALGKLQA